MTSSEHEHKSKMMIIGMLRRWLRDEGEVECRGVEETRRRRRRQGSLGGGIIVDDEDPSGVVRT